MIAHINSLLTTAFLSIDRYIAVEYSIFYHNVLTVQWMFCVLIALWLLSVVIAGIQWLNDQIYFHYHRNRIILSILFRTIVSTVLLSIAKYTNNARKRHTRAIEERQNYFGIEREKLDILKVKKKSLTNSLKLDIATVVVMTI